MDSLRGTSVDPDLDDVAQLRLKRRQMTPPEREPAAPLTWKQRLFDVSIPEQIYGAFSDEPTADLARRYTEDLEKAPTPVRFLGGALRSLSSPAGLTQFFSGAPGVLGKAGMAADALYLTKGVNEMATGETGMERGLGAVDALAGGVGLGFGIQALRRGTAATPNAGPRPVPKPDAIPPLPRGFRELNDELGDLNALTPPPKPPVQAPTPAASAAPPQPTTLDDVLAPAATSKPAVLPDEALLDAEELAGLRKFYGQNAAAFREAVRRVAEQRRPSVAPPAPAERTFLKPSPDAPPPPAAAPVGPPPPSPPAAPAAAAPDLPMDPPPIRPEPTQWPRDPLFDDVLADARAQGYDMSDDMLRDLFGDSGQAARSLRDTDIDSLADSDLIRLIREQGGLSPEFMGGRPEEIRELQSLLKELGLLGKNSPIRGAGPKGRSGLKADDLTEQIRNARPDLRLDDGNDTINALIQQLRDVRDGKRGVKSLDDYLAASGVQKGRPWWDDVASQRAGRKVADDVVPSETPDARMGRKLEDAEPSFLDDTVEPWDEVGDSGFRAILRQAEASGAGKPRLTLWNRYIDAREAGNAKPTLDDLLNPPSRGKAATAAPSVTTDATLKGTLEDILATGETQPRLPGAVGATRNVETVTPPVAEAPFALGREVAPGAPAAQTSIDDLLLGAPKAAAAPPAPTPRTVPAAPARAATAAPTRTQADVQRRISEMNAKPSLDDADIEELGRLYSREAEIANDVQLRGGTGKERKGGGGVTIGFGPGVFQDLLKPENRPLALKVIRATGGALVGGAVDDENSFRGALIGGVLAASVPSGLKAIKRAKAAGAKGIADRLRTGPKGEKDISVFRLAGLPEQTVPEIFYQANRGLTELQSIFDSADLPSKLKGQMMAIQKSEVVKGIREASKKAASAGLKRKAYYAKRLADAVEGKLTRGQEGVKAIGDLAGMKLKGNELERYGTANVYRVLTGYALDTSAKNLTQPILMLAHVSPRSLGAAYKVVRDPRAKALAEKLRIHTSHYVDTAEDLTGVLSKGDKKTAGRFHPQKLIILSDNLNRRIAYFAALAERGELDTALRTGDISKSAREFAESMVRKTQGSIGSTPEALQSNPLLRGPVGGSLKPFTKFPTLFIENMVDALNGAARGDARKQKYLIGLLGAAYAGKELGIDLEDLLLGGGRPLGMGITDLTDPAKFVEKVNPFARRSGFPVGRAVRDAVAHVTGDADHDVFGLDPRTADAPTLAVGRYPIKAVRLKNELAAGEIDGGTALANLLGLRTTEQTEQAEKNDAMYDVLRKSQQESRRTSAMKRRTGPKPNKNAYGRVRRQLPRKDRGAFDQRFRNDR